MRTKKNWIWVLKSEVFLWLLIIKWLNMLTSMWLYWNNGSNFHNNWIAGVMLLKHFLWKSCAICTCTWMTTAKCQSKKRRLLTDVKVRPISGYLNKVIKEQFCPSRYLLIDKSMESFKRISSLMEQYMPRRPLKISRYGYYLCCYWLLFRNVCLWMERQYW